MVNAQEFSRVVTDIISRHPDTPLAKRWEEAQSSDPVPTPSAFWIRESDDLINIAWLTERGISDITWMPGREMSSFNFLRHSAIIAVEMREAPEEVARLGLPLSGKFVVYIRASADRGGLVWVAADDPENVSELRRFTGHVLKTIAED